MSKKTLQDIRDDNAARIVAFKKQCKHPNKERRTRRDKSEIFYDGYRPTSKPLYSYHKQDYIFCLDCEDELRTYKWKSA